MGARESVRPADRPAHLQSAKMPPALPLPALLLFLLPAFWPADVAAQSHTHVPGDPGTRPLPVETLRVPAGFTVNLFADGIESARSLTLGAEGTVFVGSRGGNDVIALRDEDGDGVAEKRWTVARGLRVPNGVAFLDGDLYVAEISRILRLDEVESHLDDPLDPVVVTDELPKDRWHGWKFIAFGPDGWLYVPVGAPCNVCEREEIYAAIHRMKPDGTGLETVAHGVRNTVGFDWHPVTGELWFTDNGRDHLGDDLPPCELNRLREPGLHFGFPYCHGKGVVDPDHGEGFDCADFEPPALELGAHVAPLGMRFYTGESFPDEYRGQIFLAEHGSWNRSRPAGYRVTLVRLEGSAVVSSETFVDGWLSGDGEEAWGRPVDVLVMPDGALLVSDDRGGAIYRVSYSER